MRSHGKLARVALALVLALGGLASVAGALPAVEAVPRARPSASAQEPEAAPVPGETDPAAVEAGAVVVRAVVDDTIHPISAEYVLQALGTAADGGADLFLLQLSTPGGLDEAMRDIMQAFLASEVPVCVWIAPSGARAASAGFMIALAADLVVMAEGTSMGSAHPVPVGGGALDETMAQKVVNDAVAYARSVAERRGRPPDLAEEAVAESRSFAASEAVELGLADFIAGSVDGLLAELDGARVRGDGPDGITLDLAGAEVLVVEMTLRQRVLSMLANPQIAYLLLLGGLAGLYFELANPGAVLPGVVGAVALVLGLLALQQLPISWAGLALIALAVIFFILEVNIVSYGLLSIAGIVSFVLGSLLLFSGPIPELRLDVAFVLPTALAAVGIIGGLTWLVVGAHRGKVTTGEAGLVSETGRAVGDFGPATPGKVFVHGEIWRARADVPVEAGQPVEVVEVDPGLIVQVRPLDDSHTDRS